MKKAFDYTKLGISAAQVKSLKASAKGVRDRAHGKKTNWYRDGQAFAEAETFIRDKDFNNWARQEAGVGYSTAKRYARAYTMITERYPGKIDDLDLSRMAVICDLAASGMLKEVVDELLPQVVVDGAKVTRGDVTAKHIEWAAKLDEPAPIEKPRRASKQETRIDELSAEVVELQNKLDAQDDRNRQAVQQPTEQLERQVADLTSRLQEECALRAAEKVAAQANDQTALIEELRAKIVDLEHKLGEQSFRNTTRGQHPSAETQIAEGEDTVVSEPQETAESIEPVAEHEDREEVAEPDEAAAPPDPAEAELARIEAAKDKGWMDVLGFGLGRMQILDPIARQPQIREAYHRLVKICHPGAALTAGHRPRREDAFKALNCARDTGLAEAKKMAGGRQAA